MTPKEIMQAASDIYYKIDKWGIGDLHDIKQAVKKMVRALYELAKMQLPPEEKAKRKSMTLGAPKKKRRKTE